jgi:hypothetical protein
VWYTDATPNATKKTAQSESGKQSCPVSTDFAIAYEDAISATGLLDEGVGRTSAMDWTLPIFLPKGLFAQSGTNKSAQKVGT